MTEDPLPYGDNSVNKAIRPLKVVPFRKTHYVQFPSAFAKRMDIGSDMKGLMMVLLGHVDKQGCCWPTKPQIQEMAKMGRQKLDKMLNKAKDLKLITWTHFTDEYGHLRNRYTLLFLRNPYALKSDLGPRLKVRPESNSIYSEGQETVQEQSELYG